MSFEEIVDLAVKRQFLCSEVWQQLKKALLARSHEHCLGKCAKLLFLASKMRLRSDRAS